MKTITFFSYKGGVGRTLAATNFAVYLAKLGLRVAILDFDLDAPGVDSKFPDFTLPAGQPGLIDYILRFQRENAAPGPVKDICCSVPVLSPREQYALWLIPAGDYLSPDYSAKLNELSWNKIFSESRDGVAFFQLFLDRIEKDLNLDVLIIDSRTGFSEISGLCTQQLADETVILSSLARESIKMTRHLSRLIRESEVSRRLNKEVETKVVVSRVPKQADIDKLKARCCKLFDVADTKLFFLFSCSALEREEFVAMLDPQAEEALVASYIQLFQGLNIEVAQESIREEIERTERGLLSCSASEAEARIREMVALYPHPEVYRRAMRFFALTRRPDEATLFAIRLLDLRPGDEEGQLQVASFVLSDDWKLRHLSRNSRRDMADVRRMIGIADRAYLSNQLSVVERVRLADLLEDLDDYAKSFEIAKRCLEAEEMDDQNLRNNALAIAARSAMKLGKKDEAAQLLADIPVSRLTSGLAFVAIQLKREANDKEAAFEIAKTMLSREVLPGSIRVAAELANELGRRAELEEMIRMNPEFEARAMHNPELIWELERLGFEIPELRDRSNIPKRGRFRRG